MVMILLPAALIAAQAYQGELRERLAAPIVEEFDSAKKAYDLEVCVADALTVLGTPTAFRDGPDNIVIAASMPSGNAYLAAVTISKSGDGSHLALRLRGKGWNDRLRSRISGCL